MLDNFSLADDRSNARGVGMSFGSMVSSFGIDAYGVNPANYSLHKPTVFDPIHLDLKKNKIDNNIPKWEVSVLSLGGGYGSDTTMDFYNTYLKYLSINRTTFTGLFTDLGAVLNFRNNILPSSNTNVSYDFELKWLSLNYTTQKLGTVNFTISDKIGLNSYVGSRDEYMPLNFEIIQHSDRYDLVNINLNQSEAVAWWIRKFNVSYAKNFEFKKGFIKSFAFGISTGMVTGYGNVTTYDSKININTYGIRSINGSNHVDSIKGKQDFYILSSLTDFFVDYKDGARTHFTFFPKPAGTGYSFDLGINAQLGENFRVATSITEIGSISWNYNTIVNHDTNSFIYRDFFLNSNDPTYNRFVNDLDGIYTREINVSYTTSMPTKYRAGIMYQQLGKLVVEFDWIKGDNNLPGNTTKSLYAIGSEYYPLNILALRAGASVGGLEQWTVSFGAGVRFTNLIADIAVGGINNIISDKRLSLAFSTKLIL